METRYEYGRRTYSYHQNYVRNSKAVGVLWGVFTICFAVLDILVFLQPFWLGNTLLSPKAGVFGLFRYCTNKEGSGGEWTCSGQFDSLDEALSPLFRAATILVGVSVLLILLCIACMLLFFFLRSSIVYWICGSMQFLSFCCLLSGCVVFAASWDISAVKEVCGHTAGQFSRGTCELRWSYILAIIGIFDVLFLAVLAFFLANKQVHLLPKVPDRGESNLAFNGIYTRGPMITPLDHQDRASQLRYGQYRPQQDYRNYHI